MSSTAKTLILVLALAGAAAGLSLYAYFGVLKGDERAEAKKEQAERLVPMSPPDAGAAAPAFAELTVTAKGTTTRLARQADGTWTITAPIQARADADAVGQIVQKLEDGRFKSTIEEKPSAGDLEKYGLAAPRFSVTATGPGGTHLTLEAGMENSYDGSIYVRKAGDPAVYAMEGGARFAFERSTLELRDKRLVVLEPAEVSTLTVTSAGPGRSKDPGYALKRSGASAWELTRPKAEKADEKKAAALTDALKAARATAFLTDSAEERKRRGLSAPILTIEVGRRSGPPITLRLGEVKEGSDTKSYALAETAGAPPLLVEVDGTALDVFKRPAADLLDKSLLSFESNAVARVELNGLADGRSITLVRETSDGGTGSTWQVQGSERGPAKEWKVSSLLWLLKELKAERVVEDDPKAWGKYGLTDKARTVTLLGSDGKRLGRLVLGSAVPKEEHSMYARGQRNQVVAVDSSRLSELPARVDELLDRPTAGADAGS